MAANGGVVGVGEKLRNKPNKKDIIFDLRVVAGVRCRFIDADPFDGSRFCRARKGLIFLWLAADLIGDV